MTDIAERLRYCAAQSDPPTCDLYALAADESDRMRAALLAAAEQFARYADHHLAKVPPDREKAEANVVWAARCREAAR
jgi:hypothetical protein